MIQPTSKAAHDSIKEHKQKMYEKITDALLRMKVGGTFEEISQVAQMKPDQVWKRLPEMILAGKVFNAGYTRPTSSGRQSMVRQLVGMQAIQTSPEPKTDKQKEATKIVKTISQAIESKQLNLL